MLKDAKCLATPRSSKSPALRALDAHDLRGGLRARRAKRTLACISRTRPARSPQRVARTPDISHSRLHFVSSTRTISAEGCIFGWRCSSHPPPLKREFVGKCFSLGHLPWKFSILTRACLHWDCTQIHSLFLLFGCLLCIQCFGPTANCSSACWPCLQRCQQCLLIMFAMLPAVLADRPCLQFYPPTPPKLFHRNSHG